MSGILIPMVHTTNTKDGIAQPVTVDQVVSIEQNTIVVTGTGGAETYTIEFVINAAGGQTMDKVIWRYATDVLRDADMVTLLPLVSVSL